MTQQPATPHQSQDPAFAASTLPAEAAERRDWPAYFDRMGTKPARETCTDAIERFESPGFAIDLGCGEGRDTEELLAQGWNVLAIDGSQNGIDRLIQRELCAQAVAEGRLTTTVGDFEQIAAGEIKLPPTTLLNASFALPFCPPEHFDKLWKAITNAVEPGGRFCGQLFGDRDGWSIIEDRTHLTRDKAIALFEGWVLDSFKEEDRPSTQPGMHKHWHLFHIVARKRTNSGTSGADA